MPEVRGVNQIDGAARTSRRRFHALLLITAWSLATAHLPPSIALGQTLMQPNISAGQARRIADAIIAECSNPGELITVTIAIVDRAGQPVLQLRADTASPISPELAYRKAYTALSVRRSSLEWRDLTAGESDLAGQRMLTDLIPLGGGAPIMLGDQAIGAVGVSGARGGQPADSACAEHGAAVITATRE
jgi:uncharacterized protein GlcG (DUF336 family)